MAQSRSADANVAARCLRRGRRARDRASVAPSTDLDHLRPELRGHGGKILRSPRSVDEMNLHSSRHRARVAGAGGALRRPLICRGAFRRKKLYGIDNLDAVMPESRQFDVDMWAKRRTAHLMPFFLRRIRAKIGCRQPHGAIMERSRGSLLLSFRQRTGCNAAKFGCGYPASATRDPWEEPIRVPFACDDQPLFGCRLCILMFGLRRGDRARLIRRRSRSVRAHDAACVGAVGAAGSPQTRGLRA